jgi:hypothetical protein
MTGPATPTDPDDEWRISNGWIVTGMPGRIIATVFNGEFSARVVAEHNELIAVRAHLVAEQARANTAASRALDEVKRIVKSEAGPGDVYMRADVLSVIAQVRAALGAAVPGATANGSDETEQQQ